MLAKGKTEGEKEDLIKYQDLARELRKLWKVKTRVVPIDIGAVGTIPKRLIGHLESIEVNLDVAQIQKTALLGTAWFSTTKVARWPVPETGYQLNTESI